MGKCAKKVGLKLLLGPKVYSFVGKMKFHEFYHKFLRASLVSLYGIPLGRILSIPLYAFTCGYLFLLATIPFTTNNLILISSLVLIILRVWSLSRLNLLIHGKQKFSLSFVISDALMLFTLIRCFFKRDVKWAGHSYHISKNGRIQ